MLTAASVFLLFVLLFYTVFIKPYKEVDKLPGPSTIELIKNFYYYGSRQGIITYLRTLNQKYGRTIKIWMKPFKPMIVTIDMEYVEKIYKSDKPHIRPSFFEMTFLRNGIASNRDYHVYKKDKRLINKAITREYIAAKLNIYDGKYNEFLNLMRKNLGKPFDVEAPLHRIALETMMHTVRAPNVELTEQEIQNYAKYREDFFNLLFERMNSLRMMGVLHKLTRNYQLMNECTNNIVKFGRVLLERFKTVSAEFRDKHNLVYAMINGGMPEERIIDNINTVIQGGHDTSIIPLALGLHEMSLYPETQQKLLNEIHAVIGCDKTTPITLNDLDRMIHLQAFVKECLRCYMPSPYVDRLTSNEIEVGGIKIPQGIVIMFNLVDILTSKENYDDPLVFNPDRFLTENLTTEAKKAYICFGSGLKKCPGMNIAYASMKLLLVKILREFEICPLEQDQKVELISEIFFRSVDGIPVLFKQRG